MKLIIIGFPPYSLVYYHCQKSVQIFHSKYNNKGSFNQFVVYFPKLSEHTLHWWNENR